MALEQGVDERLDWTVDWKKALKGGDTLASVEWLVDGLTVGGQTSNGTTCSAFLSGGEAGRTYAVKCKITTTYGRIYNRRFKLNIVAEP